MEKMIVKIIDPIGLHARPASIVVAAASKFLSEITIESNGNKGTLKSIMNVMALGIRQGATVTIEAVGSDEKLAIKEITLVMVDSKLIDDIRT